MTRVDSPPLWPGHKPAQLYVVIQEPKTRHRGVYVSFVWFTHADSKTDAVLQFDATCPQAERSPIEPGRVYKKPVAHVVTTGGEAIRV